MKKSTILMAVAGAAIAAPALAQDRIDSMRSDISGTYVNIYNQVGAQRLSSSTASQDDCSYSTFTTGVTNAALPGSVYRICSNGFVQISSASFTGATQYSNSSIPASGTINGSVACLMPWWDDFITNVSGAGGVYALTANGATGFAAPITVGGNVVSGNVTVIQWQNMDLYGLANTTNASFELQIFATPQWDATSGNMVYAQALYGSTTFNGGAAGPGTNCDNGASATIGWQRGNAPAGANYQWGFGATSFPSGGTNTVVTPYSGNPGPTAGTVLSYVPTPGAASLMGLGLLASARRRRV